MKVLLLPLAAAVLVVAGWYGGPLVHSTSAPTSAPRDVSRPVTTAVGPIALSSQQLFAETAFLGEPIFSAGPVKRARYEFSRTSSDRIYVRYLPRGVRVGAPGAHFLVVATYHLPGAYQALKSVARGRGLPGPGGSLIYVRPTDPRSVLLAFAGVPYEIEVYDPSPATALAVARSGNVRAVG